MKTSLILKHSLNNVLNICLLILLLAGTHFIYAQCPHSKDWGCGGNYLSFPRNEVVYVDIDLRLRNTSEYAQITEALEAWNVENETNGSGVVFDYHYVPTTPTPINILHITNGGLTNIFGKPDPNLLAITTYGRNDGNTNVYDATITFNTEYARNGPRGSPEANQPFYDPNAAGYDTVFKKYAGHEISHTLGVCDIPSDEQQPGKSILNVSPDFCANDICNKLPQGIQECDRKAVSEVIKYNPPPPFPTPRPTATPDNCELFPWDWCADGGGGLGGSGGSGGTGGSGGGYSIRCYDVFKGEYYYGCVQGDPVCRETVFYEYEGLSCEYVAN